MRFLVRSLVRFSSAVLSAVLSRKLQVASAVLSAVLSRKWQVASWCGS